MTHNLPFILMRQLMVRDTWFALRAIVTPELFDDTELRKLHARLGALYESGAGDVDPDALRAYVELVYSGKDDQQNDELQRIIDQVAKHPALSTQDATAIAKDFAAREYGMQAAQILLNGVQSEKYDPASALQLLQMAVDNGGAGGSGAMSLFEDAAFDESFDPRVGLVRLGLSTELDRSLGGGVANGELFVFIAPPSRGKTALLVKCGERAARQGCRVLHISLEVNRAKTFRRYIQAIGGWGTKYISEHEQHVKETVLREKEAWGGGQVFVIAWPPRRKTVQDIQHEVRRMRSEGTAIDYVIVDYAALIKPAGARAEQRWALGDIIQDLRAMAIEENVKCMSAWQVNRAGAKESEMSSTDISEAWEVVHHADAIFALNQITEERRKHVMRLAVLKQREGTARPTAWLRCNLDTMHIRGLGQKDMERLGFTAEAEHLVEVGDVDSSLVSA